MARNSNQRGRNNNNPEGHNQYDSGWMNSAKDRPMATAAAAAAAVGAGVFLWSRRNQISDQISSLSSQVSDWAANMQSSDSDNRELETADSGVASKSATSTNNARTGRKQGLASGSNSGSAFEQTGV